MSFCIVCAPPGTFDEWHPERKTSGSEPGRYIKCRIGAFGRRRGSADFFFFIASNDFAEALDHAVLGVIDFLRRQAQFA